MFTSKQRPMPMAHFPEGSRLVADFGAMLYAQNRVLEEITMAEQRAAFLNLYGRPGGFHSFEMEKRGYADKAPLLFVDEVFMHPGYVESMIAFNRVLQPPAPMAVSLPKVKPRPYQSKLCYEFQLGDFVHKVKL